MAMPERELIGKGLVDTSAMKTIPGSSPEDFSDFKLKTGHPKKYRGNHRSQNRGKGIFAFFRNKWMKSIK